MRLAACCQTAERGPSITDAATSSPRCAGRQWRNQACSPAAAIERVVDGVALERGEADRVLGLLAHRGPHVGVDRVGAAHRFVRIGGELDDAAEVAGPLDGEVVELVPGRRRDRELDAGERGARRRARR